MMVSHCCECCRHLAGQPKAVENFYRHNFVPERWELNYFKLSECRGVSLIGHCGKCYDKLEGIIPLPEGVTGDEQMKAIYDTVQTAHPYDKVSARAGYYGECEPRSLFYRNRDKRQQFRRSTEFLSLFNDYDREQARLWLEKNFPPQKHTEVFRDTGGSLFCAAVRLAKKNGDFDKAEAILDYMLPCEHETGRHEKAELTDYEFCFEPVINYGCEGIYIDCYLTGKFDESGRCRLHIGSLKTLRQDLEAAKIMGELCGILMHYGSQHVNQNLHRYTPDKELKAECDRQLKAAGEEQGEGSYE